MTLPRDHNPAKAAVTASTAAPPAEPATPTDPTPSPTSHHAFGLRDGLDGLRDLMDRLLAPDGCPWDQAQTLDSLRPYLIEEAYEVLDAMTDPPAHCRELGDLLLQIVFQSALRERQGAFTLDDVIAAIRTKMLRRHPHVFAKAPDQAPLDAEAVSRQWAQIKLAERSAEAIAGAGADGSAGPDGGPPDPLAGVPRTLPALQRAWRLQDKAASVGFDWPSIDGAVAKVREEWEELEQARQDGDKAHVAEEFGDLLFVLVRYGEKLGITAEDALRATCAKFEARFAHVMATCHARGIDPNTAGLKTLDEFWDDAKAQGIGRPQR